MKAMLRIAAGALLLLQGAMGAFVDNSEFKLTQSQKLQGKRSKDTPPQSPDSKKQLGPIAVQTTEGPVIGDYPQWNMQTTNLFYGARAWKGLAYAQPPVGALRFKAPQPAQAYQQRPYEAVNQKPPCPQYRRGFGGNAIFGDEDCLYLDVYSPVAPPNPATHPNGYPVLVYFHGGFYTFGDTSSYDGVPFAKKNTVVVNVSFRVGIFGAMLSQDGTTFPGNQHLLDQLLALQWVQANIGHFDGDKGRVFLMGSSTGSSDILCHMTAPASQGLFHGVIVNSAYFIQRYDTEADAKAVVQAAISQVGCAAAADPDACIAAKSTHDLVTLEQDYFLSGVYTGPGRQTDHHRIFGPFIKAGGFLPRQPFEAFQLGLVSDVPMITGTVRGEGGTQTFGTLYPTPITTLADFKQVLATRFGPQNVDRLVALYPYPNHKIYVNSTDYRFALQDMFGDYWRQCGQARYIRAAQTAPGLATMKQSSYAYLVRFTPTNNYATQIDAKTGCQHFICHGDSLALIWEDVATIIYAADAQVARSMNSAFNNFVHTSDPNVGNWQAQLTDKYPKYALSTQKSAIIDFPKGDIGRSLRAKQCTFWDGFAEP